MGFVHNYLFDGRRIRILTIVCIIHQIRNSLKYIGSKHQKEFMKDLKFVYKAVSQQAAEAALDDLEDKWGDKYSIVIKSWRKKWHNLSIFFKVPRTNPQGYLYHQCG